jgi:hypothetical protein
MMHLQLQQRQTLTYRKQNFRKLDAACLSGATPKNVRLLTNEM